MDTNKHKAGMLRNVNVDVKTKLAALWTAVMFLYAYNDIMHFVLQTGSQEQILSGQLGGMQLTPAFLFGAAVLMAIPSLMIFLSVALNAKVNRWVNIIFGSLYTLVTVATWLMPSDTPTWAYYYFNNILEVVLTLLVVWHAVKWPRMEG
jgi:hypothetical protein